MSRTTIAVKQPRPGGQRKPFHLLMMFLTCGAWTPLWVVDALLFGG